ncbi:hypothetical protein Q787_04745 [Ornithobacterium rhinotracheale H06-030791]|nr:hypothetical protein Q785_04870 [Ornithobacterium rhinotracheale ORT-UMN 88]KGB67403.1 hypothetical protein Q787_04745 [Ornithobacterium rhinotracheale H06-030791]
MTQKNEKVKSEGSGLPAARGSPPLFESFGFQVRYGGSP